jgi:hypothetical protein
MGRLAILMVAGMMVLAGCSTGGGGGDGTPESTETTDMSGDMTQTPDSSDDGMDGDSDSDSDDGMDGDSDSDSDDGSDSDSDQTPDDGSDSDSDSDSETNQALSFNEISSANETITAGGEVEFTLINGSQELSVLVRNDTENQFYRINNNQQSGERLYYISDGPDAFRNTSTGETLYAEAGNETIEENLNADPAFGGALLSTLYFRTVTWEQTGTRNVDGDTRTVYEPLALNESFLEESLLLELTPSDVQSFEGEVVSGSDGILRSGTIQLDTSRGAFTSNINITVASSLTVERPDWFDESQVPN